MKLAAALVVGLAITACTPLVCKNGSHTDPLLCGPAPCSTDTDCAERFGGNGDPDPA